MKDAPLQHRIEYAGYRAICGFLRLLPHAASRPVGRAFGSLAHGLLGGHRRRAIANLEKALPELPAGERKRIARACFRHLGAALCDTLSSRRFDAVELCRRLTLEGWEHLEAAESRGKGVLIMSAHLGLWEIAALPIGIYSGPMDVVGRPPDNPYLRRDLVYLRTRFGNRTLDKRGAARGMLKVLRAQGRVGLLIDQRPGPQEGIVVPFFGRPARTTPVLARLSLRTGAPVVPLYGYGEPGGTYRVVFRPLIEPQAGEAGGDGDVESDDDASVLRLTRRYLEVVEDEIRRQPELWLWLHDRWRL